MDKSIDIYEIIKELNIFDNEEFDEMIKLKNTIFEEESKFHYLDEEICRLSENSENYSKENFLNEKEKIRQMIKEINEFKNDHEKINEMFRGVNRTFILTMLKEIEGK